MIIFWMIYIYIFYIGSILKSEKPFNSIENIKMHWYITIILLYISFLSNNYIKDGKKLFLRKLSILRKYIYILDS